MSTHLRISEEKLEVRKTKQKAQRSALNQTGKQILRNKLFIQHRQVQIASNGITLFSNIKTKSVAASLTEAVLTQETLNITTQRKHKEKPIK